MSPTTLAAQNSRHPSRAGSEQAEKEFSRDLHKHVDHISKRSGAKNEHRKEQAKGNVSIGFAEIPHTARKAGGRADDVGEDEAKHDRELACRAQFNAEEDLKA